MNKLNEKEAAQEGSVQEQPKCTVIISITNLDKLNNLISEIIGKLNELKNFKLGIETQLDIDKIAEKLAEKLKQANLSLK